MFKDYFPSNTDSNLHGNTDANSEHSRLTRGGRACGGGSMWFLKLVNENNHKQTHSLNHPLCTDILTYMCLNCCHPPFAAVPSAAGVGVAAVAPPSAAAAVSAAGAANISGVPHTRAKGWTDNSQRKG